MKRNIHIFMSALALLLLGISSMMARPITEDKARTIATKFYYIKVMGDDIAKVKSLQALDLVYSSLHTKAERWMATSVCLYRVVCRATSIAMPDTLMPCAREALQPSHIVGLIL